MPHCKNESKIVHLGNEMCLEEIVLYNIFFSTKIIYSSSSGNDMY